MHHLNRHSQGRRCSHSRRAASASGQTRRVEVLSGPRPRRLITLLIATGLRPSELLALRRVEYDEPAGTLAVTGKVVRVPGEGLKRVDETKSAAGRRTVPLPRFAIEMLQRRPTLQYFGEVASVSSLRSMRFRARAKAEWTLPTDRNSLGVRAKRYWVRVRSRGVPTPYLTTAFVGSMLAIVAALKALAHSSAGADTSVPGHRIRASRSTASTGGFAERTAPSDMHGFPRAIERLARDRLQAVLIPEDVDHFQPLYGDNPVNRRRPTR